MSVWDFFEVEEFSINYLIRVIFYRIKYECVVYRRIMLLYATLAFTTMPNCTCAPIKSKRKMLREIVCYMFNP